MYTTENWEELYSGGLGYQADVYPLVNPGKATVVEVHERPSDGYGEYVQGDEECYIIFEIDGRFFKKTGTQSSYDEVRSWDGPVREVYGNVRTVRIFEEKRR